MKVKTLLKKLLKDYDHPWPNEDKLTAKHRIEMWAEIKRQIFFIDIREIERDR